MFFAAPRRPPLWLPQMVKLINRTCDALFNYFGFGAHKNSGRLQVFLCVINVVFSIWPITCYLIYSTDIHVVYWLGKWPQYTNLCVPLCLLCLNLGVNYFQCFTIRAKAARLGCVSLFMVLGAILMLAGGVVMVEADTVSGNLIRRCGNDPLSAKLQSTWTGVKDFITKCDPTFVKSVESCPDFLAQGFRSPDELIYYAYLVEVEWEFECAGFCEFYARPLFNRNAETGTRCSSALGREIENVIITVGLPTFVVGAALLTVGLCLAGYDHL